jgi:hypothetical protein
MAMQNRSFTRATLPHIPTLAASLAPLLAAASAGSFHLLYEKGQVFIEQASFTGVNLTSVQTEVTNAPAWTERADAKNEADRMSLLLRGAFLTMLDLVNAERARHSVAALTPAQFMASVKSKVDAL